ncbi:MAG: hypothetical protein WCJ49_01265 [Deltaproteobacteria bacterium]
MNMMGGIKATTTKVELTDVNQLLSVAVNNAIGSPVNWNTVSAAMITVENHDCRIAFGCPATATIGHILSAGQAVRFSSADHIKQAQVINKTAGSIAVIQITLEG